MEEETNFWTAPVASLPAAALVMRSPASSAALFPGCPQASWAALQHCSETLHRWSPAHQQQCKMSFGRGLDLADRLLTPKAKLCSGTVQLWYRNSSAST